MTDIKPNKTRRLLLSQWRLEHSGTDRIGVTGS